MHRDARTSVVGRKHAQPRIGTDVESFKKLLYYDLNRSLILAHLEELLASPSEDDERAAASFVASGVAATAGIELLACEAMSVRCGLHLARWRKHTWGVWSRVPEAETDAR